MKKFNNTFAENDNLVMFTENDNPAYNDRCIVFDNRKKLYYSSPSDTVGVWYKFVSDWRNPNKRYDITRMMQMYTRFEE